MPLENKPIDKIRDLLCNVLESAIKAQLNETRYVFSIGYGSEHRESSENVSEIFFRYGLKVRLVDSPRKKAIIAQYEVLGKFREIFVSKGIAPYFDAYFFEYDEEECVVISNESQLRFLKECDLTYLVSNSEKDSLMLEKLYEELRRAYLFLLIKS